MTTVDGSITIEIVGLVIVFIVIDKCLIRSEVVVWVFPGRNVILISESEIASSTLSVHSIAGVGGASASAM